jgi:hypothetical protein
MADSLVFLVMIAPVVSRQLAGRREFWCFTSRWEHLIFSSDDILSFSSTWSTQTESIVRRNRFDFEFPLKTALGGKPIHPSLLQRTARETLPRVLK